MANPTPEAVAQAVERLTRDVRADHLPLSWEGQREMREDIRCVLSALTASAREREELLDVLQDVLNQACGAGSLDGRPADSMAISAYADGLRCLADRGAFKIEAEHGRRVIGQFVARPANAAIAPTPPEVPHAE